MFKPPLPNVDLESDNVTVKGVPIACSTHKCHPIVLCQKINIGPWHSTEQKQIGPRHTKG